MVFHLTDLIFIGTYTGILLCYIVLYRFIKNPKNISSSLTYLVTISIFSLLATCSFLLYPYGIYRIKELWFVFHFHGFMSLIDREVVSYGFLEIDLMSILIISFTLFLALLSFVLYQISYQVIYHRMNTIESPELLARIDNVRARHDFLAKFDILIIDSPIKTAYSFSIIGMKKFRPGFKHVIVMSEDLGKFMTDDEIEVTLIHEYAHTVQFHTYFSCLPLFICQLFFFIPLFQRIRKLIWESNEMNADLLTLKITNNPSSLATAICKSSDLFKNLGFFEINISNLTKISNYLPFRVQRLVQLSAGNIA